MLPKLDPKRAREVIAKIDSILAWDNSVEHNRDTKFVELGRCLCEVRAGQYWRTENLKSFDQFLENRFPESRRKAYYLMSIHEHLPKSIKKDLAEIGWAKAVELVKVARSDREQFDCQRWVRNAQEMPREQFRHEVEKHLTGRDSEPSDIIYFKLYKTQIPIIEKAIEIAALMLGSDKSRGYCLEMICADFLAGATLHTGTPDVLFTAVRQLTRFLPSEQQQVLAGYLREAG